MTLDKNTFSGRAVILLGTQCECCNLLMSAETRHRHEMCETGLISMLMHCQSDLVCVLFMSLSLFVCSFWCTLLLIVTTSFQNASLSGHIWTVWREYLCFSFPLLCVSFILSFASVSHLSLFILFPSYWFISFYPSGSLKKSLTLCLTSKGRAREGQPDQDAVRASRAVHNWNGKKCSAHRGAEKTVKER